MRWSQAVLRLGLGDFRGGWPLYEARLELPPADRLRHPALPRWSGAEPLAGRTLLVYADQGLGDTLQFCRYVPVLEAMGATRGLRGAAGTEAAARPRYRCAARLLGRGETAARMRAVHPAGQRAARPGYAAGHDPRRRPLPARRPAGGGHLEGPPRTRCPDWWWVSTGTATRRPRSSRRCRHAPFPSPPPPRLHLPGVSLVALQKGAGAEQRTARGLRGRAHPADRPVLYGRGGNSHRDRGDPVRDRSGDHGRHGPGTHGRRAGGAGMGHAAARARLALAHRAVRQPVVPDDAAVPPARSRGLGGAVHTRGRRTGGAAPAHA